jgi:hypothetical protein
MVGEAVWLFGTAFVDLFEDGQASECCETPGEVVGVDEGFEVFAKLVL